MNDTPIGRDVALILGKLLKEYGQDLAGIHHQAQVWRGELAFIDVLLAHGSATTDDIVDDLLAEFKDGGKWRSNIPKGLARLRLIEKQDVEKSRRVARHAGLVWRWRVVNRDGLIARRTLTAAVVRALDDLTAGSTGHGTAGTPPNGAGGPTA